jgi:hypothetical protein
LGDGSERDKRRRARRIGGGGAREGDGQVFEGRGVRPHLLGQSHHEVESAVAFEDLAGFTAADGGGDDVEDVVHVQAVSADRVRVGLDAHDG